MPLCNKQHLRATFKAPSIDKLSNTETELKKSVAYKKNHIGENTNKISNCCFSK